MQMFWCTCAECRGAFVVARELRHAGERLICPFCKHRFLPEEAASLDERWVDD